jgi:hypothetical protein
MALKIGIETPMTEDLIRASLLALLKIGGIPGKAAWNRPNT